MRDGADAPALARQRPPASPVDSEPPGHASPALGFKVPLLEASPPPQSRWLAGGAARRGGKTSPRHGRRVLQAPRWSGSAGADGQVAPAATPLPSSQQQYVGAVVWSLPKEAPLLPAWAADDSEKPQQYSQQRALMQQQLQQANAERVRAWAGRLKVDARPEDPGLPPLTPRTEATEEKQASQLQGEGSVSARSLQAPDGPRPRRGRGAGRGEVAAVPADRGAEPAAAQRAGRPVRRGLPAAGEAANGAGRPSCMCGEGEVEHWGGERHGACPENIFGPPPSDWRPPADRP
ncbi:unnamed protein product [Prorocentrum cordatum]|uniref:Uncharacterized protein n=1 Tax=Prorocentrum cordatum TaxID=2364126 RepID=A0ABN9TM35_9DINO|nr:unnamed protein product [Polarella glacialis]